MGFVNWVSPPRGRFLWIFMERSANLAPAVTWTLVALNTLTLFPVVNFISMTTNLQLTIQALEMFNTALRRQVPQCSSLSGSQATVVHAGAIIMLETSSQGSNQVCFLFKQGSTSWQVESCRLSAATTHTHTHRVYTVCLFANTVLSAATGVAESNTDTALTWEELSSSDCLSGSVRRSLIVPICLLSTKTLFPSLFSKADKKSQH